MCNTWQCGSPEQPLLFDSGDPRAEFKESFDTIDVLQTVLSDICQWCFSDANTLKFRDNSQGLVDIPSYDNARAAAMDDVSSDGDSGVSGYSS